jgi:hypothetical protein
MCSRLYRHYLQKRIDEIEPAMSASPPMAGPSKNPHDTVEPELEPELKLVDASDESLCV